MIVRRHSLEKENANAGENMISNYFFMEIVKCLGNSWDVSQVLFIDVEEYIWTIYNAKIKFLTMQEKNIFTKKYSCLSVTRTFDKTFNKTHSFTSRFRPKRIQIHNRSFEFLLSLTIFVFYSNNSLAPLQSSSNLDSTVC